MRVPIEIGHHRTFNLVFEQIPNGMYQLQIERCLFCVVTDSYHLPFADIGIVSPKSGAIYCETICEWQ
jgi:hypothetical protein